MRLLLRLAIAIAVSLPLTMSAAHPWDTKSPCSLEVFEGSRFTVCREADQVTNIELYSTDQRGKPLRSFAAFQKAYPTEARYARFGMNAGMFQRDGRPLGLLIEQDRVVHPINRRSGWGNFYMKPNGVFSLGDRARVTPTDEFRQTADVHSATQSGPMLVIEGNLNPTFQPDGESRNIRNGVGVDGRGEPIFVISEDPVSFGKFGRFFRDVLHTPNALYFDGSVSSLWDPDHGREDHHAELGPMVIAFDFPE